MYSCLSLKNCVFANIFLLIEWKYIFIHCRENSFQQTGETSNSKYKYFSNKTTRTSVNRKNERRNILSKSSDQWPTTERRARNFNRSKGRNEFCARHTHTEWVVQIGDRLVLLETNRSIVASTTTELITTANYVTRGSGACENLLAIFSVLRELSLWCNRTKVGWLYVGRDWI